MFDPADPSPEYELAWPRDLFVAEVTALPEPSHPHWLEDAELLLEEAFIHNAPKDELRTTQWYELPPGLLKDPSSAGPKKVARAVVSHLVNSADQLSERSERRPYWSVPSAAAQSAGTSPAVQDRVQRLQREWAQLVDDLQDRGYLDWVAPRGCDARPPPSPAVEVLAAEIERRLRVDGLWPLRYEDWDIDTFYGLIEAVHDLVGRPRHRDRHDFGGCSWHYSNFAPTPAQVLYRWDVNQLLDRYSAGLRIAVEGEDTGRLVRVAGDDVALFRNRAADRENKRSAVLALHRVLEDRRSLIKAELMSKDEGALFQIANEFDLRHSGARQRTDYEDAYLDWIFWWYLATVELTDRIAASQVDSS